MREILKRDSRDSFTGLVKSYPSIETNIVINNHLKLSSKLIVVHAYTNLTQLSNVHIQKIANYSTSELFLTK